MNRWRRPLLYVVLAVVLVVAVVEGFRWWSFYQTHVSTDDAYVRADYALVTARVPGTVVELSVEENAHVEAGAPLLRLDAAELEVRLRQAEAGVSRAIRTVEEMKGQIRTAESQVAVAEAELAQLRLDHRRAEQLAGRDVVPKERFDRASLSLRAGDARLQAARRELERAQAALGVPVDHDSRETAIVREAIAARDEAALLLSYAEVRAPMSGVVARRSIEVGQRIQAGQPLMMIVPLDEVYVEANFKETQLAAVRVGQPVEIESDLYPDVVYRGRVESIAPGSGAAFALLPPENATGNWVKVVQRVPVRISIEDAAAGGHPLRISTSVVATIDVGKEGERPVREHARRGDGEAGETGPR